jgi:hypothetical protein
MPITVGAIRKLRADKRKVDINHAKKDAYKESLKKELRALGKSTKGSIKDLEKKLEKYNKEALKESKSRSDQEWNMKVSSYNKSNSTNKSSAITALLTKAANMSSGGAEWAKKNASLYGLKESDVTPYLVGNWGDGYRGGSSSVPNGEVQKLMDNLGVSKEIAEKLILQEMGG